MKGAQMAGINTAAVKISVFVIAGALVGIGAFLWIAMNASADPATTGNSYEMYAIAAAVLGGIALGILGVLAIFAPILIGFTSTATFQLWLNCAQTFGKEIAGIPSASVSMMQTYYSAGTMVALVVTSLLITKFKQVRFLVIYPAISVVMLVLVYLVKTPMICFVGAFVIGYAAAGGVLQMATATENDLFPNIKGIITSLIMIASSLCNYTILSAAAKMSSMQVIMMNIVITVIGVLLAVFVNVRYGSLLAKTEQ